MSTPRSQLGNSWVVDDVEDDRISWADDNEESAHGIEVEQTRNVQPGRVNSELSDTSHTYGKSTTSEFIMPSISNVTTQRKQIPQSPRSRVKHGSTVREVQPQSTVTRSKPTRQSNAQQADAPSIFTHIANFILELLGTSLRNLKTPISWVISAYLFWGGIIILRNLVTSSISNALSPICRVPGVSFLNLPICTYTSPQSDYPTIQSSTAKNIDPEFDALMTVQSKFDSLLTESSSYVALPLDMKRSEASIRDLRQVVRFSTIPSKNELLHEFDGFIETARMASYDLQKFNSHVGRTVDNVLATARWTMRVLDEIAHEKADRGVVPAFIQDTLLAPFQPIQFTEARLLDQYIQHSQTVSGEIERLLTEAQALLLVLSNLEDRIDVIHGISLHDNIAAQHDRDEILGNLWTYLGGNAAKLGKVSSQLSLLARVGDYRKIAYAHVSGTIVKLQAMGAELEELRTRVDTPQTLRGKDVKGVPLSVHLDAITLGVERLEGQREKAREVEKGYVRRIMDDRGSDEVKLVLDA